MQGSCLVGTWATASSLAPQMAAWSWSNRLVNTSYQKYLKHQKWMRSELIRGKISPLQACLLLGRKQWWLAAARLSGHQCMTCCCGTMQPSPPATPKLLISLKRYINNASTQPSSAASGSCFCWPSWAHTLEQSELKVLSYRYVSALVNGFICQNSAKNCV